MTNLRWWIGPVVAGVIAFFISPFAGWWVVLILVGYFIGYVDSDLEDAR